MDESALGRAYHGAMRAEKQTRKPVRFAGYAALFDVVDRGGDVVRRGAFAEALGAGVHTARKVPLCLQHDPARRIGTIETLAEDERGLRVIARLYDWTPAARDAAQAVRSGLLTGLSFGYRVRASGPGLAKGARRTLTALDLVEVSLVEAPMQPRARVHMVI